MSKSWEQILGGYATDTLTEEEKRQLCEAALQDQSLFDALADEEALKALLADPEARQRILASLQASGHSPETVPTHPVRLSWFRRPSALAWAGSLAAMGLALIFGWQMNKDWGPLVQQEQEAERTVSEDRVRDDNETVLRPPPVHMKNETPAVAAKKKDEGPLPNEKKPQSDLTPLPEADSDNAEGVDSFGRVQGGLEKKRRMKGDRLGSSSFRRPEPMPQNSNSFMDLAQPQVDAPPNQPLAIGDTAEVLRSEVASLAPAREPVSAQTAERSLSPPGALDLFYASFEAGQPDKQGTRTDVEKRPPEKASSESSQPHDKGKTHPSFQGKAVGGEAVIQKAQGIRYSFLRATGKREEELAEGQEITGDWRDVRLTIEPNVTGFLYVFAPVGLGKWQQLEGVTALKAENNPDGGNVKAFQTVEYQLGVITNRFGKLVISSVTVLLSPAAIENVGNWLSGTVNLSELQIERTEDSVYVVRPGLAPDAPFRVVITLEE